MQAGVWLSTLVRYFLGLRGSSGDWPVGTSFPGAAQESCANETWAKEIWANETWVKEIGVPGRSIQCRRRPVAEPRARQCGFCEFSFSVSVTPSAKPRQYSQLT